MLGRRWEAVEAAVVLGLGDSVGEVGYEVQARGAGGLSEGEEAVIGDGVELPVLGGVVDLGV